MKYENCAIYKLRSLNCRRYPRTQAEFITEDTCGFYFETAKEDIVYEPSRNKVGVSVID